MNGIFCIPSALHAQVQFCIHTRGYVCRKCHKIFEFGGTPSLSPKCCKAQWVITFPAARKIHGPELPPAAPVRRTVIDARHSLVIFSVFDFHDAPINFIVPSLPNKHESSMSQKKCSFTCSKSSKGTLRRACSDNAKSTVKWHQSCCSIIISVRLIVVFFTCHNSSTSLQSGKVPCTNKVDKVVLCLLL